MNVGIDARVLEKGVTGIGRYLQDVLNGLPLYDKDNRYFLFSYNKLDFNPDFYSNISTGNINLPEKLSSAFWLNFILHKYLKRFKIDVFFTPNQLLPLRKIPVKSVITVHDIAHKENKKYHPFLYRFYIDILLPNSLMKSDRIITISEHSKKSIIESYKIESSKIEIIHRTADKKFVIKAVTENVKNILARKFNLPKIFVLYVGMIENRKNIYGILKISDLLKKNNYPIELVLIGRKGHGFNNIYTEMLKRQNVHYLNNVNDNELVDIYNLAFAFLFPSFFEGFGLPPLEAMQCGLPVLVSNRASLPEVVGEAGIVKEPEDYEGFANEIIELYKNPEYRKNLQEKSIEKSLEFNYLKSIEAFLKIINFFNAK